MSVDGLIRQLFAAESTNTQPANYKLSELVSKLVLMVKDYDAVLRLEHGTEFASCIFESIHRAEHIEATQRMRVTRQTDCIIVSLPVNSRSIRNIVR